MRFCPLRFALCLLVLLLAPFPAAATDADLQQYNRPAVNVEAVCGANPLTSSLLLPVDGKKITADNNAAGKAPVNRGAKQMADYAACVRCAAQGNCAGVNLRTMKALQVDGTGGNVATAVAGTIVPSLARSGTSLPTTANPQGVITADSQVFAYCSYSYSGTYSFVGGFNCGTGITNPSAGTIIVNTASAPSNYLKCVAVGSGYFNSGANLVSEVMPGTPAAGKMPLTVYVKNTAGLAADAGFQVLVFCGM